MKTKNNVQKAVLRSLAVIVSFVLISFTVSAQEFWKKILENSSLNEIALVMVDTPDSSTDNETTSYNADFLIQETDEVLELENWMTSENNFSSSYFLQENEAANNLEDWMFNQDSFDREVDEKIVLEDWMTNEKYWEL